MFHWMIFIDFKFKSFGRRGWMSFCNFRCCRSTNWSCTSLYARPKVLVLAKESPHCGIKNISTPFKEKEMVSFTDISVRTFDLCIGVSPAVKLGVPITLDWTFTESPPVNIDEFESFRPQPRRTKEEMKMSAEVRHRKLVEDFGVPPSHIQRVLRRSVAPRGIYRAGGSRDVKIVSSRPSRSSGLYQNKEHLAGSSFNARPLVLSSLSRRTPASKAA